MGSTIRIITIVALGLAACQEQNTPAVDPPGEQKTVETKALEVGARLLQRAGPSAMLDMHLVGHHPLVHDPGVQVMAHHYCRQVNEDFIQCALWDSNRKDANLSGVEFIISRRMFEQLPRREQQYWHPHNYEILSGLLVAPGLPQPAELALMKGLMNSYGKTWHVWNTSDDPDELPMGPARLAWSFNADGELAPGTLERRDRELGIDTEQIRRERQVLAPLAEPQHGVDELADAFPGRQRPSWVQDLDAAQSTPQAQ